MQPSVQPKVVPIAEIRFDDDKLHEIVDEVVKNIEITPRWIPVSERLPEDHDWYLIVAKEKDTGYQYIPRVASYQHDNHWRIIDTDDAPKEWLENLECVAWTSLPEPYKESEDKE